MSIKFIESKGVYEVSVHRRHPKTGQPTTARRRSNLKGEPIKTEAEARRVHEQLLSGMLDRFKDLVIPRWGKAIDQYCDEALKRGLMSSTVENYRLGLRAHTLEIWGRRRVNEITTQEIRELMRDKLGEYSEAHRKSVLKFIRAVFNHALEIGAISRNPCPEMKFRIGDKIKGCLTEPQVRAFLEKARELDSEWYYHWALALYTGMRNGELFALTWDKVNFDTRMIKIDTSWNNQDGFKSTKSGDDRQVEIAPNLMPVLQELKLKFGNVSTFVLPRIHAWEKGEQARELRMFLMGMGLPSIRFHDLRATWATILLSKGVPPIKVMYAGGWKDMKTMCIYMRKAGVEIKGMMDGMDLHNPSREPGKLILFSGGQSQ